MFDPGDRQLITTWAMTDSKVEDALARGDSQSILTAQKTFARKLVRIAPKREGTDEPETSAGSLGTDDQLRPGNPVESAMPDGSIFSPAVR